MAAKLGWFSFNQSTVALNIMYRLFEGTGCSAVGVLAIILELC